MNDFSTFTYDGTTYNVKDTEARQQIQEIINNLSPQDVVQSDYNQNDTSAADYIKNRPLIVNNITLFEWDGDFENAEEKIDMSALTGISDGYFVKVSDEYYDLTEYDNFTFISSDDNSLTVTQNEYTIEQPQGLSGVTLLQTLEGLPALASVVNDITIPDLEMSFTKGLYVFYLSTSIEITKCYTENSVQIDFEDNNKNSYTYIKNKPCGKKIVTLLQQDLENIDDSDIVSINEEINYVYVSNEELGSNLKDYEGNTDISIEWNIAQFVRNGKELNWSQIEDDEYHLVMGYMLSESTYNLPIIVNVTNHSLSYMGLTFPRNGIYVLYQASEDWEGYNTIVSIKETQYIKIPIGYLDTLKNDESLNKEEYAHKIITAERLNNFNYLTNSVITNTLNQYTHSDSKCPTANAIYNYFPNKISYDYDDKPLNIELWQEKSLNPEVTYNTNTLVIQTQGQYKGLWWNGEKII